jgi:transcriptional regulator with XRE-family HTH domain
MQSTPPPELHITPQDVTRGRAIFAARLREVRTTAGLTQQELADRVTASGCKLFRAQIGKIETGLRDVTVVEGIAIADALGVTLGDLATDLAATVRYAARVELRVRVRTLAEQVASHDAAIHEHEVLRADAARQLAELEQTLADLEGQDQ